MTRSVGADLRVINGNVASPIAITVGLDVADAAYHTAHDFPGGVPALAQRMQASANSLFHKLDLNNTTHHLTLRESVTLQAITGDVRILQAMAGALGYVCINLRVAQGPTTMRDVMQMAKEFADVMISVNAAAEDGKVTPNEMQECERQTAELVAAVNTVLGTVRAMMPSPPGGPQS